MTCSISGISAAPITVVWKKTGSVDLSNVAGYTVVAGTFNDGTKTQTTTLALTGAVNKADTVYTCDVTPSGGTVQSTQVTLNVFGEFNLK